MVRFAPAVNLLCLSGGGRMLNVPLGPAAVGCWLWRSAHSGGVWRSRRAAQSPRERPEHGHQPRPTSRILRCCGFYTRLRRRRFAVRRAAGRQANRDRDALPACQKRRLAGSAARHPSLPGLRPLTLGCSPLSRGAPWPPRPPRRGCGALISPYQRRRFCRASLSPSTPRLFPRGVVADMDCSQGHSLVACSLRSQLWSQEP